MTDINSHCHSARQYFNTQRATEVQFSKKIDGYDYFSASRAKIPNEFWLAFQPLNNFLYLLANMVAPCPTENRPPGKGSTGFLHARGKVGFP